jgi:chromatin structure-remodeling complex subunit RSC4
MPVLHISDYCLLTPSQDYFRHLMSELPTPFALPQYAKPARSNKIKLKMPGASQSSMSASSPPAGAQPSFTLRVPGGTESTKPAVMANTKAAQRSPMMNTAVPQAQASSSTSYANQLPVAPMTAQTYSIQPIQATPRQPLSYQYTPHHYPNASYQPPMNSSAPSTGQVTTSALPHIEAQSFTKSPSPSNLRPLKGVLLTTKPRGRPFKLDYRDGVRSWAMRLGQGEGAISIAEVRFLGDEEEEGSEDETHDEEDIEEDRALRNGKGKAKKGRGRPKANTRAATATATAKTKVTRSTKLAPAPPKSTTPSRDSVKILLNGSVVKGKENCEGEWEVELRLGLNVLELGEDGGMIWKVYMERVSI